MPIIACDTCSHTGDRCFPQVSIIPLNILRKQDFLLLRIFEKFRVVFVREAYYVNIYSLLGLSCELDIQSLAILLAFVHLYIVAIAFLQSPYMHLKEAPIPILHFLNLLETYVPKIVANS